MAAAPEIFGSSIVALGSFNAAIFTPDWLERNNLIGSEDAEGAQSSDSLVVSKGLAQVETNWFQLQVLENRLAVTSKDVLSPQLKDLAVGMFSLLLQTPVTAVGLNFTAHYRLDRVQDYHKIGDVLAPKDIWTELYPGPDVNTGLGNLTIVVEPFKRDAAPTTRDRKQIAVQPSPQIKNGVLFSLNDHHEIVVSEQEKSTSAEIALRIVEQNWQTGWDEAKRVFDGTLERALAA
jgi:hypothetical protein